MTSTVLSPAPATQEPPDARPDFGRLSVLFRDALLTACPSVARAVVDCTLRAGASPEALYAEVMAPALHDVGRRWEAGQTSIARERLATTMTESLLAEIAGRATPKPPNGRRAVVACVDEERHAVGARMVADLLEAQGWEVGFLGADVPADALCDHVEDVRPALVALSVAMPANLRAAATTIDLLRALRPRPFVAIGGSALGTPVATVLCERADIATSDLHAFMRRVETIGGFSPASRPAPRAPRA